MKSASVLEICAATGGVLEEGSSTALFSGISTDTRSIKQGDLFIPLVGKNYDGHDFAINAIEKGASGILFSHAGINIASLPVVKIKVNDTLKALGDIASFHRKRSRAKIVAITGSVGKTSTKDMTASVLAVGHRVIKSEANFNNEIGLPLTLLKLDDDCDFAVVEMGMRAIGEISRLSFIAQPDICIITNIGVSHIERLGSRQNILKAKLEIIDGMNNDGIAILNGDDPLLLGVRGSIKQKTLYYGMGMNLDFIACDIMQKGIEGVTFSLLYNSKRSEFCIKQPGLHNVYNALAAITAGISAGMAPEEIASGLRKCKPNPMRLNIVVRGSIKVIDDTYNASPQSMVAALDVLSMIPGATRRIAILGDMLEMGDWAVEAHKETGYFAASRNIDRILTIGELSKYIALAAVESGFDSGKIISATDGKAAIPVIADLVKPGDAILVKGSRGMKMEEVVEFLFKLFPECDVQ